MGFRLCSRPDMEDHRRPPPSPPAKSAATATAVTIISTTPSAEIRGSARRDSSNSSGNIILGLISVVLLGCISLWADTEAGKGFRITVQNDAGNSPSGRKFHLLYVSNDKATQLVLKTSQHVEALLYPPYKKKPVINHVTLRLASQNLSRSVTIDSYSSNNKHDDEFVINLSPLLMEEANFKGAMSRAVSQGMARVWVCYGHRHCHDGPNSLINGLVEYVSGLASGHVGADREVDSGSGYGMALGSEHGRICWKDENPKAVASFLGYCEDHRKGFIQRLNQAMSHPNWHDGDVEKALGLPAQRLCSSYTSRDFLLPNSLVSSS